MSTHDTIVIGAGLFGCAIALELQERGERVLIIDSAHERRGSAPAACLMKPSWFSGLDKDVRDAALGVLGRLYDIQTLRFRIARSLDTDVLWIRPSSILQDSRLAEHTVRGVCNLVEGDSVRTHTGVRFSAPRIVVAAGVWSPFLLRLDASLVRPQAGAAFLWTGLQTAPAISPWAPFRQLVKFDRGDGAWVGDGTSLKPESLDEARIQVSLERCTEFSGLRSTPDTITGFRPYVAKAAPAWVEELRPGLWVATGGAKNGTIAAGWAAHVISSRRTS
jgi:glycine/D-amino acid oxidase-like deaminating enzyme